MDVRAKNFEALRESALFQTIPADVRDRVRDLRATSVGFGAGPGFVAQRRHTYPEPVHLAEALSWIEAQTSFKRAHVELEDGRRVLFDPNGFEFVSEQGG